MSNVALLSSAQANGLNHEKLNREQLKDAFNLFNSMSAQLSQSYEFLESRVEELSGELAEVSLQRMRELAEKERIAERLESLLHMLPGGILLLDGEGRIRECNPAAQALLIPSEEQVAGDSNSVFEADALLGQRWRDVIALRFSPKADDGHEISLVDGRRVSLQTASLGSEPGQIILITDQTETRKLQDSLSQHQRLSSMGNMVASLAHQIRTPLSAAMIYGEHLQNKDLPSEQREKFANKMMLRLHHLEHQIRDMLIFARGEAPLNDDLALSQLLHDWQEALEIPLQQHNASCEFQMNKVDVHIHCNRDALIGALMNLVNNALEACGQGAQLKVRVTVDKQYQVNIEIEDNGPGFGSKLNEQILQPFFTTKSNGTGLGLAVVQAIARAHYGEFNIASGPQGAIASLRLPAQPIVDAKTATSH
ncbi:MAG: PAS domain-containing protein [Oleispira sp.]|nr:PAS domain-containing protein [Oleispira sp.]MBL4881704.1 PAS domain-containing protein [Oleispira sp.]